MGILLRSAGPAAVPGRSFLSERILLRREGVAVGAVLIETGCRQRVHGIRHETRRTADVSVILGRIRVIREELILHVTHAASPAFGLVRAAEHRAVVEPLVLGVHLRQSSSM